MKKNKGFTLIELLAVIVILAVIALIATPIVIGIIEDSRKKTAETSMHGIIDAANFYAAGQGVKQEPIESPIDLTGSTLSYQGRKPEKGVLIFNTEQDVQATAYLNGYCLQKNFGDEKVYFIDATKEQCGSTYDISGTVTFSYNTAYKTIYNYEDSPTVKVIQNNKIVKEVKIDLGTVVVNGMKTTGTYQIEGIPYGTYDVEISMLYHMPYTYKNVLLESNKTLDAKIYKGDINGNGYTDIDDSAWINQYSTNSVTCPDTVQHCLVKVDINADLSGNVQDSGYVRQGFITVYDYPYTVSTKGNIGISNATVTLKRNDITYTTTSDSSGNYVYDNIPAGSYLVFVRETLYQEFSDYVNLTNDETINFELQLTQSHYETIKRIIEKNPGRYYEVHDLNKDLVCNQEDIDIARTWFERKSIMVRKMLEENTPKVTATLNGLPNTVVSLSFPGHYGYNVTINETGKVVVELPRGNYTISPFKLYYSSSTSDSIIDIDASKTINITQTFGDYNYDNKITQLDIDFLSAQLEEYQASGVLGVPFELLDIDNNGIFDANDIVELQKRKTE